MINGIGFDLQTFPIALYAFEPIALPIFEYVVVSPYFRFEIPLITSRENFVGNFSCMSNSMSNSLILSYKLIISPDMYFLIRAIKFLILVFVDISISSCNLSFSRLI